MWLNLFECAHQFGLDEFVYSDMSITVCINTPYNNLRESVDH